MEISCLTEIYLVSIMKFGFFHQIHRKFTFKSCKAVLNILIGKIGRPENHLEANMKSC